MSTKDTVPAKAAFTNDKIVVLATYLAGGNEGVVDTEDIAVQANRIAPGRFTWRKYKEQINIDTVRKRLWDATKPEKGGYLTGSEKVGWLLTQAGLAFCQVNLPLFETPAENRDRLSQRERSWFVRERVRMLNESAFEKWRTGASAEISSVEAESFFRIDDYVIGNARRARLKRATALFRGDAELGDAVTDIAKLVRER
jgi:hypothetical protein